MIEAKISFEPPKPPKADIRNLKHEIRVYKLYLFFYIYGVPIAGFPVGGGARFFFAGGPIIS